MLLTSHCLKDRRCGLLDFVFRPRKAGAGATRDEERLAQLEGELYDPDGFIGEVIDDTGIGFRVKAKVAKQRAQKLERPEPAQGPGRPDPSGQNPDFGAARDQEGADERSESSDEDTANPDSAPLGGRESGGSLPTPPPIPQRRAAIGATLEAGEDGGGQGCTVANVGLPICRRRNVVFITNGEGWILRSVSAC